MSIAILLFFPLSMLLYRLVVERDTKKLGFVILFSPLILLLLYGVALILDQYFSPGMALLYVAGDLMILTFLFFLACLLVWLKIKVIDRNTGD